MAVFIYLISYSMLMLLGVFMAKIAVVYHSGFGHTKKAAEAIVKGIQNVAGSEVTLLSVAELGEKDEANWAKLDAADGILFGAPTYMGSVSAQFKTFIDAASVRWFRGAWKNKIGGGFTNSGSYSGDKFNSLVQLFTNAMQHHMIWVGLGLNPGGDGKSYNGPEVVNRMGSFSGLMTQAYQDSPEVVPGPGDLKTAEIFGERFATITE